MPTYTGFSTINIYQPKKIVTSGDLGGVGNITTPPQFGRKFRLVDDPLVLRDLLNAFSIKQGDKVGQPTYGTTLWSYVFEPGTGDAISEVEMEVRRVIEQDPRIILNTVGVNFQENGLLLEIEIAVQPFNQPILLGILLDKYNGTVQAVSR
jgi:phage baseplate assembly protein W